MTRFLQSAFCLCLVVSLVGAVAAAEPDPGVIAEFQEAGMPDEILFAVRKPSVDPHWYGNIGYYSFDANRWTFPKGAGGALRVYNLKTKETRTVFEDPKGNIRDPQLHYDGKRIVFSYLPEGADHYSLYEINLDGTNLRRLTGWEKERQEPGGEEKYGMRTDGWDDIEPAYLPDDSIVFCSSRVNRYVQCWATQVATVHRCDPDGANVRELSCNAEQDNTPWPLANGQIAYMRWEYIDRNHLTFHHLWTMNPDGTKQMIYYGNQRPGGVFLDFKSVPDSGKTVGVFSPGHGMKEHYGRIALFSPLLGPDAPEGVEYISKTNDFTDPWAFSEDCFLAASRQKIVLLDREGNVTPVYELPEEEAKAGFWIGEPRPVMEREREPIIADQTNPADAMGTFALGNIYRGRKMGGLEPGVVKELLVYEALPKPINYSGAMSEVSSGGAFQVERLLGRVPVSKEGSAYFKAPAMRALFFVALDEKGHCVKRMHSFTSVMPGEKNSCIGCHEDRGEAPTQEDGIRLAKLTHSGAPVDIEPVEGVPEFVDYMRDVQPILDRHCLECHNPDREEGGFNISGHWAPLYTIGYQQMSWRELFGDNRVCLPYDKHERSNFEPYEIGTGSSRLLKLMEEGHGGTQVPENELKIIRFWLDSGATYSTTYACNSHGSIGHYVLNNNSRDDKDWPELADYEDVLRRRCDECHAPDDEAKKIGSYTQPAQFYVLYYPPEVHQKNMFVARSMAQDGGRFNRHMIFDLSYPEQSKVARGPLAKEAGGLGVCEEKSGKRIFADKNDPDYLKIVAYVARGRKYILEENNRFTMILDTPNNGADCPKRFVPRADYVRELKRYGVLPPDWDPKTSVDPYELDVKYWDSLRYKPPKKTE